METIPIEMIVPEPSAAARAALLEADIIIGVDTSSQREFTAYGTPPLESTMTREQLSALRVVRVTLDANSKELERLIALVRRIKGPEFYQGTDE